MGFLRARWKTAVSVVAGVMAAGLIAFTFAASGATNTDPNYLTSAGFASCTTDASGQCSFTFDHAFGQPPDSVVLTPRMEASGAVYSLASVSGSLTTTGGMVYATNENGSPLVGSAITFYYSAAGTSAEPSPPPTSESPTAAPSSESPTTTAPATTPPPTTDSPSSPPPSANPAFVQANDGYATASKNNFQKQFNNGVSKDNLLVVSTSWDNSATTATPTVTDTLGTSFTLVKKLADTTNEQSMAMFYGLAPSSGTDNVTVTYGAATTYRFVNELEYSGVNNLEVQSSNAVTSNATQATTTPATATQTGILSVGTVMQNGAPLSSMPPAWAGTNRTTTNMQMSTQDLYPTPTTSDSRGWTFNAGRPYMAVQAVFDLDGSGGSTPPPSSPPPTSPSPSPTGTGTPPPSSFPNASNTGYQWTGVTLHSCGANLSANTTYDSCSFSGDVNVGGQNVHITRSLINGQVKGPGGANEVNQSGLLIQDTEINCHCGSSSGVTPPAIYGGNFTLNRVNMHNAGHMVQVPDNNVVVENSWLHDNCCSGNTAHADSIISNGGASNVTVSNNTLDGAGAYMSAAVGLFGDFGSMSNWTFDHNLFNTTGSYCVYAGNSSGKPYGATNMHYTNNHFGKKYNSQCGIYGAATAGGGSGFVWTGNVWDDGSGSVLAP